jgi:hypothetical protein
MLQQVGCTLALRDCRKEGGLARLAKAMTFEMRRTASSARTPLSTTLVSQALPAPRVMTSATMFCVEDRLDHVSVALLLFNVDHAFSEDGYLT